MWSSPETSRKSTTKQALKEAKKICRKPRRGQKIKWMKLIEKDLENIKINLLIKDSDKNTKCIEINHHEKNAKRRHEKKLVVDRAVSATDGGA